jgi:hypothetical protein
MKTNKKSWFATTSSKRTIQSTVDQKQCNAASDEKKTNKFVRFLKKHDL